MRDEILAALDLPIEPVDTPEWAAAGYPQVWVRGLSGNERDAWELSRYTMGPKGKLIRKPLKFIRAGLVVLCVVDDNGARVFNDDDAEALGAKSGAVIDRLFDKARALSGLPALDEGDEEAAEEPFAGARAGRSSSE